MSTGFSPYAADHAVEIHEPEPCADMHDMRGWVKVTCEESDQAREAHGHLKVFSSLTDMEGSYGEAIIYTEWGDRATDRPVVRDYRWLKSDRECEHYLAADQLHENGEVRR